MKFIIGLGNPGEKYHNNRHNVGFVLLDILVKEMGLEPNWQQNQKLGASYLKNNDLVLIKPQNFMNNSGQVSRQVINFFDKNVKSEDIFVIHDDLDLKFGEFKIQLNKGPKSHNGLLDLDRHLGTTNYWHVRVGVDNRLSGNQIAGADYVLEDFTPIEMGDLSKTSEALIDQLKSLIEK